MKKSFIEKNSLILINFYEFFIKKIDCSESFKFSLFFVARRSFLRFESDRRKILEIIRRRRDSDHFRLGKFSLEKVVFLRGVNERASNGRIC